MANQPIYIASQSKARHNLLTLAQIPFSVIEHKSSECEIPHTDDFDQYVLAIAQDKMKHAQLPSPNTIATATIIVLTADTLMRTEQTKEILSKPQDMMHAKQMLALLCQQPAELVTGCCLEKKEKIDDTWRTIDSKTVVSQVKLEFCVEPDMVDTYFEAMPDALHACGAGIVESFGLNFLKSVHGSYSAVMGLPLFELRHALVDWLV